MAISFQQTFHAFLWQDCIFLLLIVVLQNLKNMLFLGDGGVYLMSIILSISLIYEHNIHKSIVYADEIFFLLLLPGLDLLRLTISRSLDKKNPIHNETWPTFNSDYLEGNEMTIAIQINGKLRGKIVVNTSSDKETIIKESKELDNIKKINHDITSLSCERIWL